MASLTPPNPHDKDLTGFSWQEWFRQIWSLLNGMEHIGGHWYLSNGGRHAITTSAGIKTTNTTVVNSTVETTLYSYTFSKNELHTDENIIFSISGVYSNASASDDFHFHFYVGGTIVHTVNRVGGNQTNAGWQAYFEATVRTIGTSGMFVDLVKVLDNEKVYLTGETTGHNINTNIDQEFKVTIHWDNAKPGNTLSCTQGSLVFHH